jgi:hypothetical protein
MFEEIVKIIKIENIESPLNTNKNSQEFLEIDSDVRNYLLPTMPPHILQNIICDITKQSKMDTVNRSCYSYDNKLKSFVQQETDFMSDASLSPFIIEYYNEMIFLEMINIEELANYLHINSECKCKCIALPIMHGYHKDDEKNTTAHISVIIFDNINKLVYHIDSNGWSNTKKFLHLENFLEQNINMLCGFGLFYNYIRCEYWNEEKIYLNINYNHYELNDAGNCMIWTILIIKLMQETDFFPAELFDKLEKLEYEEKIFVMKAYGTYLLNTYARDVVEKMQIKKIKNPKKCKYLFSNKN